MISPNTFGPSSRRGYLELPLRRLSQHRSLTEVEHAAVRDLTGARSIASRGQTLSAPDGESFHFILDGWAAREWTLPSGRRQIFEIVLPGDVIGRLPTDATGYPAHSCRALTSVTLIEATSLGAASADGGFHHPGIVNALSAFAQKRNERLVEHLVRVVSRNACESIGHLMLELYHRQSEIGLTDGERFPFIVGQACLGELLGLSAVHINRSLKKLRDLEQVQVEGGWARVNSFRQLAEQVDYPLPLQPVQ